MRRISVEGGMCGYPALAATRPTTEMLVVSKDYFRTLDQPILAGRAFDDTDRSRDAVTCIVNLAFVEQRLGGREALGRTVQVWRQADSTFPPQTCQVVGVAGNAKRRADELVEPAQIYSSFAVIPSDDIYLVVRPVSGDAAALTSAERAAIAASTPSSSSASSASRRSKASRSRPRRATDSAP